jgi:hypothetical protein
MKHTGNFNLLFAALLLTIGIYWVYLRPFNSPWQPFIAGDGLGYYSHLPAIFIYDDPDLEYKWFNEVHNKNYTYSAFENPEDNLLVGYGNRKINKYYPGLSFAWMPLFLAAHAYANVSDYAADGYSAPYQWAMGIASLFWLIVGLIFLRKLIKVITGSDWVAVIVPVLIFFGTNLYHYGIFNNTLSHVYSFSVNTMFLYYAWSYFNRPETRTVYFLLAGFALLLSVSIRPLNGLILFACFAFIPQEYFSMRKWFSKFRFRDLIPIAAGLLLLVWHFYIMHKQTGSLFAYTYTNEKFDFTNSRFVDALFSYHNGLFVYTPIALVAFGGMFFMRNRRLLLLPVFFLGIVFLYASWWYWPITRRALIDFYPLLAVLLGVLLSSNSRNTLKWFLSFLILFSVVHYQLKNYQVNKGILSEYSTYDELYWRNYFRTDPANIYPVPPSTILASDAFVQNMEQGSGPCQVSNLKAFNSKYALLLDSKWSSCIVSRNKYPELFSQDGWRKVRISFDAWCDDSVTIVNMYLEFRKRDSVIVNVPFYLVKDFINPGKWDYKEFGYEITDTALINGNTVDEVTFAIWNPAANGVMYADNVKMEFLLTDRSFETIR